MLTLLIHFIFLKEGIKMGIKKTMQLMGAPYQFTDAVDPRIEEISSEIGQTYMRNIMTEAPICTIIPGEPKYLPKFSKDASDSTDGNDKESGIAATTYALAENFLSGNEGFSSLISNTELLNDDLRLYDFKRTYSEYMKYVNILCRAGAVFLGLDGVVLPGQDTPLASMDWRNYQPDGSKYTTLLESFGDEGKRLKDMIVNGWEEVKKEVKNAFSLDTPTGYDYEYDEDGNETGQSEFNEDTLSGSGYVQFYIDPDASYQEDMQNTASDSMLRGIFDNAQNMMKEFAFLANSGGMSSMAESLTEFGVATTGALNEGISKIAKGSGVVGQVGTVLSRVINLTGNVIKGQNMVLPQIYQNSSYSKSYGITVHLKTPYGSKLGYYLNVFVPMMHLIALAVPRQGTSNTYESPFLVKAYVDGVFSCNMGMVESISINRSSESWSAEGLPSEVDVTLNITDLYSQLMMSSSANPALFVANASLQEFLATNCGLSLISDNLEKKLSLFIQSWSNAFTDIPNNIASGVHEYLDSVISKYTTLMY